MVGTVLVGVINHDQDGVLIGLCFVFANFVIDILESKEVLHYQSQFIIEGP